MKRSLHAALPAIDSLLVLEQAAQDLSFTKAGERLGLTQSAVSRQIIDLETLLKVKLFVRQGRSLQLTSAGAEFRELARTVVQDLQAATLRMQLRSAQSNVLNMSVAASFCNLWFIPHLPEYYRQPDAPKVNVTPHVGWVPVERSGFDAAIVNAVRPPENCEWIELADIAVAAYGSSALLESLKTRDLQGLKRVPALMLREAEDAWPRYLAEAKLSRLSIDYLGSNSLLLLNYEAVRAGLGIGLLPPEFVSKDEQEGRLVRLHQTILSLGRSYYFIWPRGHEKEAALRKLGEWIRGELGRDRDAAARLLSGACPPSPPSPSAPSRRERARPRC